jgi:hypothetical protein
MSNILEEVIILVAMKESSIYCILMIDKDSCSIEEASGIRG